MVRELPAQLPRVETGAVRFGDDWAGVFFRGDDAHDLLILLSDATFDSEIDKMKVDNYKKIIHSCVESLYK